MFNLPLFIGNNDSSTTISPIMKQTQKRKRNQSESSVRKRKFSVTTDNRRRYFSECSGRTRTDLEYEKEPCYSSPVFDLYIPRQLDQQFGISNQTPIIQIPPEHLQRLDRYSPDQSATSSNVMDVDEDTPRFDLCSTSLTDTTLLDPEQSATSSVMGVDEDTPLFDLCSTSLTDTTLSEIADCSIDRQTPIENEEKKIEEYVNDIDISGMNVDIQKTRKRRTMKQSPLEKRQKISTSSSLNQLPCSPSIIDIPTINHHLTPPDDFLASINQHFSMMSHSMNNIIKEQESRKNKDIQYNRQIKQINFDLSDFRSFQKFKQQRNCSAVYLQRELPVTQDPADSPIYNEQQSVIRESSVCITRPSLPINHPQFYDWRDSYIEQRRQKEFNKISQSENTSQPSFEPQEYDWRADYIEKWRQNQYEEMAKARELSVN